ncbi:MAG: succinate dehydrogenase cytochrome b subunit [Candidatus Zixiibacteriota bacterium]
MNITVTSKPPTSFSAHLLNASIGQKFLMAVSGIVAFGFVVGHMLGNLQVFISQDQMNSYAEKLQSLGPLLWAIRLFLLAAFVIHIWFGIKLKLENWAARPIGYQNEQTVKASLASRTMIWTGLIILVFVIYHLLHFTVRVTNPEFATLTDPLGRPDVYGMVVIGFSSPVVSIFYLLAVGLLSYHLSHGVASMFQSLGLNTEKWQVRLNRLAWVASVLLFLGYASIPAAVLTGCTQLVVGGK